MADVRTFLRQVLGELDSRSTQPPTAREAWLSDIQRWRKEWEEWTAPGYRADTTPIHPQRAAHEIAKALPDDAIVVSDVGVHHNWLIQFCTPTRPDSLIGSMGFGPMGFGVAGVMGAKFAAPDRPCVSVCGDGAFFMHANVLGTAVDGRVHLVANFDPSVADKGANASRIIQAAAAVVGGGGGGRPTMARAGGRDPEKLPEALAEAERALLELLS